MWLSNLDRIEMAEMFNTRNTNDIVAESAGYMCQARGATSTLNECLGRDAHGTL